MRVFTLIIFTILSYNLCLGQTLDSVQFKVKLNEATALHKSFKPKEALILLNELIPEVIKSFGLESNELAHLFYNKASCQLDLAEYDESKNHLDKALNIFELQDSISVELGNTYMLIGIYYDYMADYDRALQYYELTKTIYSKIFPPNDYRFGYLYNNIGIVIFLKGDVQRALTFFNKALTNKIEYSGINGNPAMLTLNNISQCYSDLKNFELAFDKINYSFKIAEHNNVMNSYIGARIYHAFALYYTGEGDYNKAIIYSKKAYNLRIKYLIENHEELGKNHGINGIIYRNQKNLISSKLSFIKALNIYTKIFRDDHPEIAYIYTNLSDIALENKNLNTALNHINQSLLIYNYDENVPLPKDFNFNQEILKALELKAKIHTSLWDKSKNVFHLKKAHKIYNDLIIVLNKIRQGFKEELSKEAIAGEYYHVFEKAIEVSHSLYLESKDESYLKEAFQQSEYSNNFVLLEGVRNNQAKRIAGIPDSLLDIEYQLKTKISFLEKEIREEEQTEEKNEERIIILYGEIFDVKEQLYSLINKFEKEYPDYYRLKYNLKTIEIEQLQKQTLAANQTLVEYFIGEENIFVFVISRKTFKVHKIEKDFPLESWVKELRKKITQYQYPFNLEADYHDKVVDLSQKLFYKLIFPIEDDFTERLVIIPSGILTEIPFECLIKETKGAANNYKDHWYFFKDHAISYCYSATLLDEMVNHNKIVSNQNTIAFAPSFTNFGRSGNLRDLFLIPLKFNTPEAKDISNIMGGDLVSGEQATESHFIDNSKKYGILHFATHAQANNKDGDYSFLAFSEVYDTLENELLYVKDVYNLQLKSEMITLSACETGIGEMRRGEGIISLSRSFSYSGTGSINTSLWQVNDSKMVELMSFFYQNIKLGMTKDQAMRNAKIELINAHQFHVDVHPFFWTAMISIGDMRPINIGQKNIWLWISAIIGMLSLAFWFRKRNQMNILAV